MTNSVSSRCPLSRQRRSLSRARTRGRKQLIGYEAKGEGIDVVKKWNKKLFWFLKNTESRKLIWASPTTNPSRPSFPFVFLCMGSDAFAVRQTDLPKKRAVKKFTFLKWKSRAPFLECPKSQRRAFPLGVASYSFERPQLFSSRAVRVTRTI